MSTTMMSTVCSNQEVEEERERGRGDVPVLPPPPTLVAETPGWKFNPEEDELIDYFLYHKVAGIPIPSEHPILEKDLYGSEAPWDLFAGIDTTKKDLYFFTQIKDKFKSSASNKKARVVQGKGTWRVQRPNNVHRNNVVVGLKRSFSFVADKSANRSKNESWVMHEYTMINYPHTQHYQLHGLQWAVCKLSRLLKKPSSSSSSYSSDQYDQYSPPSSASLSLPNKRSNLDFSSSHMPSSKKPKNTPMPVSLQEEAAAAPPNTTSCSDSDKQILSTLEEELLNNDDPALPPLIQGDHMTSHDNPMSSKKQDNPQMPLQVFNQDPAPPLPPPPPGEDINLDIQFEEIDREAIIALLMDEEGICHNHDEQQLEPGWDVFSVSQLLNSENIDDHPLLEQSTTHSSLSNHQCTSQLQQQQEYGPTTDAAATSISEDDFVKWDFSFDTDQLMALLGDGTDDIFLTGNNQQCHKLEMMIKQ